MKEQAILALGELYAKQAYALPAPLSEDLFSPRLLASRVGRARFDAALVLCFFVPVFSVLLTRRAAEIGALLTSIRPFFDHIPKAKTAKLVRSLIEMVSRVPSSLPLQIQLCNESIEWCKAEKRTFLRQRIQAKLAALLLEATEYLKAQALLSDLVREVRAASNNPRRLFRRGVIETRADTDVVPPAPSSLWAGEEA